MVLSLMLDVVITCPFSSQFSIQMNPIEQGHAHGRECLNFCRNISSRTECTTMSRVGVLTVSAVCWPALWIITKGLGSKIPLVMRSSSRVQNRVGL